MQLSKKNGTISPFYLILMVLLHPFNIAAIIPEDMVPLNVYGVKETAAYPSFRGSLAEGSTTKHLPMLHDFQGMKKMGRNCYIYAGNNIFVLDLTTPESKFNEIPFKQVVRWESTESDKSLCLQKGQTKENCKSYVKIFEEDTSLENYVIVCSTNAFNPTCRFYEVSNEGKLSFTGRPFPGSSWRCPYDPSKRVATLVSDGSLYTATETGFSGQDAVIHRSSLVPGQSLNLRTSRGEMTMLNKPTFVRFIDGGRSLNKVYTFFTETAIEDNSYETYTRVAQACKNDNGGTNVLKNQFSSFFKARLNCSLPGQPPFYFNEIQDVSDLLTLKSWYKVGDTKMVFAVMTTPRNSIPASAICAFTLDDIERSLNGPFKEKFTRPNTRREYWDEQYSYPDPHLASCQQDARTLSDSNLNFARKHPFMHNNVPAWDLADRLSSGHKAKPIFSRTMSRDFLTTVVVDTDAGSSSLYTVLLAGTENGAIIKILLLKGGSTLLIEERHVFNEKKCGKTDRSVKKIELDKESGTMVVAFKECVIKAPLCPVSSSCGRKCIESRDPYCGWDGNKCVMIDRLYVNRSKRDGPNQPRQDVVNGNTEGMPDCESILIVKSRAPLAGATVPPVGNSSDPVDSTEPSNDAVIPGTVAVAAAASGSILYYIIIGGCCLGLGIMVGAVACCVRRRSCEEYQNIEKKELAEAYAKEAALNGHINGRHGSTTSNKKSRSASSSSHNQRHSNPRSSTHEESKPKRNRTTTETSQGSRSEEGVVFAQHGNGHSPESPTSRGFPDTATRGKQLQSTSSSVGGRRKTRSSKPSTGSSPENNEEMVGNQQAGGYPHTGREGDVGNDDNTFADDADPARILQGSNDNENRCEGLNTPPGNDTFAVMTPLHNKGPRAAPNRSMSFQDHHQSPLQRTYSMDKNGASTVGHTRPHGRGINRQYSLQPTDLMPRQNMYPPSQQRGYPPQFPPPNMNIVRLAQPPVPASATPSKNFDNRRVADYTHSLDRRRTPKGQNYQPVFSDSLDGPQQIGVPAALPPSRKRFSSESEKPARMTRPSHCQPIDEDQELLMHPHPNEMSPDPKALRNNLSLNLNPAYPGVANGRGDHSAPIVDSGAVMPNSRRFPGALVSHSNPGTPMHDLQPNFPDKIHPIGSPKGHTTLPSKNHYVPQQMSLPEDVHQRLVFPAESPTKASASSPMQDGRPPSFPGSDRMRHCSGPGYASQGGQSPVKSTPPMLMGSPNYNPQMMKVQRTRYPSGGTGRNQNGPVLNEFQPESQPLTTIPHMPPVLKTSLIT